MHLPACSRPASTSRTAFEPLRFPLRPPARVALLGAGFQSERNLREFAATEIGLLAEYDPEALVLPLDLALSLADQGLRGLIALPSLKTAIVVLSSLADSPLADHHRDLLWKAFRVPVFEQLRSWDGAVIARECEVHDGLHVEEAAGIVDVEDEELLLTQMTGSGAEPVFRVRTGLTGEIVRQNCECGAETPRLRNLAPVRAKVAAAAT